MHYSDSFVSWFSLLLFLPYCRPSSTKMILLKHISHQWIPCLQLSNDFLIHLEHKSYKTLCILATVWLLWSHVKTPCSQCSRYTSLLVIWEYQDCSQKWKAFAPSGPFVWKVSTQMLLLQKGSPEVPLIWVPIPESSFSLDDGTGTYRKFSGSHYLRSYYQTILPISPIFIHASLLLLGPQPSSLPNLWYVRLNVFISKDIWEGCSQIKWCSGKIKSCKSRSTQLRIDV